MPDLLTRFTLWVVDYRLDGQPRRWFRAFLDEEAGAVALLMREELDELYGSRSELLDARPATEAEKQAYLKGEPGSQFCPMPMPTPPSR